LFASKVISRPLRDRSKATSGLSASHASSCESGSGWRNCGWPRRQIRWTLGSLMKACLRWIKGEPPRSTHGFERLLRERECRVRRDELAIDDIPRQPNCINDVVGDGGSQIRSVPRHQTVANQRIRRPRIRRPLRLYFTTIMCRRSQDISPTHLFS
jgi:hypothetical protein